MREKGALPAGLRLTASDRPGEAQPVPVRDIPQQPWGRIMGFVAVALAPSGRQTALARSRAAWGKWEDRRGHR